MRYKHPHDGALACVVSIGELPGFAVDIVVNNVQIPDIHSHFAFVLDVHCVPSGTVDPLKHWFDIQAPDT